MTTTITKGFGATLSYSTDSGSTFTALGQILKIDPAEHKVDHIETTVIDSTNKWKTFTSGWKDAGKIDAELQFAKAQVTTLNGLLGTDATWQITVTAEDSTTATFTCDGFLESIGNPIDREKLVQTKISIKLSGEPTLA